MNPNDNIFVAQFGAFLQEHGLADLLGLQVLAGHGVKKDATEIFFSVSTYTDAYLGYLFSSSPDSARVFAMCRCTERPRYPLHVVR